MPIGLPPIEWSLMAPELMMVGGAIVLLLAGVFLRDRHFGTGYAVFTLAIVAAALVATWALWDQVTGKGPGSGPRLAMADAVVVDGFGLFFTVAICAAVLM